MTSDNREVLIAVCEQMKQVIECQLQQDLALRSLGSALSRHLPTLKDDYREAQTDSLFATVSKNSIEKTRRTIEGIIERLKHIPLE
jgi:hypothetical protein